MSDLRVFYDPPPPEFAAADIPHVKDTIERVMLRWFGEPQDHDLLLEPTHTPAVQRLNVTFWDDLFPASTAPVVVWVDDFELVFVNKRFEGLD